MSKQFEKVDCRYGAPMGRSEILNNFSGKARCFKVNLDSGGYDDGGCYWGYGPYPTRLYCSTNGKGFRMFCRASNRKDAKSEFQVSASHCGKTISWIN